jgi:hypothetical protein
MRVTDMKKHQMGVDEPFVAEQLGKPQGIDLFQVYIGKLAVMPV